MPKFLKPSAVVEAARQRRVPATAAQDVRSEWYINEVLGKVRLTLKQRVHLASEYLKDKVVRNISRPVTKGAGGKVTDRSKPGEFPKADTTQLMKSVFALVREEGRGVVDGYVGTPIWYGVKLELKMNRSFLVRTFREEYSRVKRILEGPMA